MFDNVMIGIDGEQGGRDAVALARQLASDDANFTLAHVHGEYPVTFKGSAIASSFVVDERQHAQEMLTQTAKAAGIEASLAMIGSTSVGGGLHELAEQHNADLLVVGSTRRGLLGRVLVGDDTRAALNGAPCAVAIAPAGYADGAEPLTRIGVAFDDSAESRHALAVARKLGSRFGAKLSACDVLVTPGYMYLGLIPSGVCSNEDFADRFEAGLLEDVELHARYGLPADELGAYSGSVELLVAGSRGYGPVGRLMHGSTTAHLTRTCHCPLLVLTRSGTIESEHDHTSSGQAAAKA
jgi:nucleotide-binding universal stress UspA family protein